MTDSLHHLPSFGLELPQSKIITAALAFAKDHCNELTYNHAVRSAYWSAIIAKRDASFSGSPLDLELVVLSCILHDMGWAESKQLLSPDKRFEVDGANIARDFINQFNAEDGGDAWDQNRVQRCWDAIALHTTFSIARHAAVEVAVAACGILADFQGPHFPYGPGHPDNLITADEYHAVMGLFPRAGFTGEGLTKLMCGICRDKGATTFDNFVGDFGERFGVDGAGAGKAAFSRARSDANVVNLLLGGLDALEELDAGKRQG
ncbi:metal dependent phosphohydrolase [Cordyceps fumosorosea ARSEF 2679]|uniref:Metal dependent phosphohydrolase n=1 Tax=Cordyceps fumosorosea (strain ARSEF 2679) TaxID=1081104 RepID=A0A162IGC8_CORFA|nr:metal dependent phosphohydrolase [Cordyceps fumosorosea ARSEF 2679]OAA56775.1 metal dependent phosphohydrolase [Cordyceps fumosorosea ARSEF 2679]